MQVTHNKVNNIANWTQAQLNTIIAGGAAPLPPAGTVLNDVTLPSDWNAAHTVTGTANTIAGYSGTGTSQDITIGSGLSLSGGTLTTTSSSQTPWTSDINGAAHNLYNIGGIYNNRTPTHNLVLDPNNYLIYGGNSFAYNSVAIDIDNQRLQSDTGRITVSWNDEENDSATAAMFFLGDSPVFNSQVSFFNLQYTGNTQNLGAMYIGADEIGGEIGFADNFYGYVMAGTWDGFTSYAFGQATFDGGGMSVDRATGKARFPAGISDASLALSISPNSRFLYATDGSTVNINYSSTSGTAFPKPIISYNGIATAGGGVVAVVGSGNTVGATTGVASVATFTPGATGSFDITGYLNITAVTLDVVKLTITYKDIHGTTQTLTPLSGLAAIGTNSFTTGQIRAASGTAILVATTLTTSTGSIAYDVGATIKQY